MQKPQIIVPNNQDYNQKAKKYVKLQNEGVPLIEASYRAFGNEVGDSMVRLHQHEIIIEKLILN